MENYYKYWGKCDRKTGQFHLLPYHSLDVAAVGWCLVESTHIGKDLANSLGIRFDEFQRLFAFILSVHDLGKFSSGFQCVAPGFKYEDMHKKSGIHYDAGSYRHDKLAEMVWFGNFLYRADKYQNNLFGCEDSSCLERKDIKIIEALFKASFYHHGAVDRLSSSDRNMIGLKKFFSAENLAAIDNYVNNINSLIKPNLKSILGRGNNLLYQIKNMSWYLSGIGIVADWIGSNQELFQYQDKQLDLHSYWDRAIEQAKEALISTQIFRSFEATPFLGVQSVFGFSPSPLQKWAEETEIKNESQLFIIEDVTGSGKTEAALTLTHRMLSKKIVNGFYFALPSTATSNSMHERVANHYGKMFKEDKKKGVKVLPSIVLAHSAKSMNQLNLSLKVSMGSGIDYSEEEKSANAMCNEWFSDSNKKALLAPVGVGTIDQVFQAIIPVKHNTLRLIGTSGKVLIIDEVHTVDTYMAELLCTLLEIHAWHGGSVILLTATMSLELRNKLIQSWQRGLGKTPELQYKTHNLQFPLATQLSKSNFQETHTTTRTELARTVNIEFVHSMNECVGTIQGAVNLGKSAVWIRNTVKDALEAYELLKESLFGGFELVVFHSRYALMDRIALEKRVLNTLGKDVEDFTMRKGFILVCTQVFQESLDADTDVMISDICAIDDLIQRAGRLHRHTRNKKGRIIKEKDERGEPTLTVHCPVFDKNPDVDWLSSGFPGTDKVYDDLESIWKTQFVLEKKKKWTMPDDARELIESVYGNLGPETPVSFLERLISRENSVKRKKENALKSMIKFKEGYSKKGANYDIGATTRYSEIETASIIIVKKNEKGWLVPIYEDKELPLEMSVVKLPERERLKTKEIQEKSVIVKKYRQARYMKTWDPSEDTQYGYCSKKGVFKRK